MHKPFTLLIILLCIWVQPSNAQSVKPAFKEFIYASYTTSGAGKNVHLTIRDVTRIDALGNVHVRSVYYNGVADTTYRLKESKLKELNAIFNGKQPLAHYVVRTKMEPGMHFGGTYDYIHYTDLDGKQDEITLASPFMSDDFNKALDYLVIGPSKADQKVRSIKDLALAAAILNSEKRTKDLPPIEQPPPGM